LAAVKLGGSCTQSVSLTCGRDTEFITGVRGAKDGWTTQKLGGSKQTNSADMRTGQQWGYRNMDSNGDKYFSIFSGFKIGSFCDQRPPAPIKSASYVNRR